MMDLETVLAPKSTTSLLRKVREPETDLAIEDAEKVLMQVANVAPHQFEKIKSLRAEYNLHFDNILMFHKVLPFILWLLGCLNRIMRDYNEDSPTSNRFILDEMYDKLERMQTMPDKTINSVSAIDTNMLAAELQLRHVRREMDLPAKDKWITTVEAIESLMHLRAPDTSYSSLSKFSDTTRTVGYRDIVDIAGRISVRTHDKVDAMMNSLLAPTPEWLLTHSLDVSPKKDKSIGSLKSTQSAQDKNNLQLSAAYTIREMRIMVENAQTEVAEYKKVIDNAYVKIVQFIEIITALVRAKKLDNEYLYITSELSKAVEPYL